MPPETSQPPETPQPPKETWVALISDTHGHAAFTTEALRVLEAFHPIAYLHAGDIGGPEIVRLFPTDCPCYFVQGNCDNDPEGLADEAASQGHQWCSERGEIQIAHRQIALLHGDDTRQLETAVASQRFDIVVHGHTHQSRFAQVGETRVVNPGAVYRANPPTVAILNLETLEPQFLQFR
jgi:putative phosphoesterase